MSQSHKTLLLWLLLIAVFLGIWGILRSPGDGSGPPTVWSEYLPVVLLIVVLGSILIFLRRLVAAGRAVTAAGNALQNALEKDDFEAAAIAARSMPRWPRLYAIVADLQLSAVDYSSGKFEDARARLAARRPEGVILFGFNRSRHEVEALWFARRAVLNAALDRNDEARADAALARTIPKRGHRAEATAEFSELVTLARRRELSAVRARLDAWALRSGLAGWEAAVLRALDIFASTGGAGAYRSPTSEADRQPPNQHLVAWAELLVPGIGPYVESVPNKTVLAAREISIDETTRRRVASERDAGKAGPKARNPLAIAAIVSFAGLFAFSYYVGRDSELLWPKMIAFVLAIIAVFFVLLRRVGRDTELVQSADVLDQAGKPEEAEQTISPLLKGKSDAVTANALRGRALYAMHRGDAKAALAHSERALAYLRRNEEATLKGNKQKPTTTTIGSFAFGHHAAAHRAIATTRAMALAMLGRVEDAEVELELAGTPNVGGRFVVELYGLARAGDVAGLVEHGRAAGGDLNIAPFEAAILDAARTAAGDAAAGRWLDRKLQHAPGVATFLERAAPSVFSRVKKARGGAAPVAID